MPADAVYPRLLTRVLSLRTRGLGCNARPAFPAPSLYFSRVVLAITRTLSAARTVSRASPSAVMPRACGASNTPPPFDLSTGVSEILDRPIKPGDDEKSKWLFDNQIRDWSPLVAPAFARTTAEG